MTGRNNYITALNPKGYVNNREITNLDGQYLVKGSKNVLIFNQERVDSAKGYTLIGAAKTINRGVKSSYDWYTSTGVWRNMRVSNKTLEVWYAGAWVEVDTSLGSNNLNFTPWWDSSETLDKLLFVDGSDAIYSWSGAIAEVASVTSNTITKKKYVTGTTYAFNDNGASEDTITDSASGFATAGFVVGDTIIVSGSASNDGEYTIKDVTASTITISEEEELVTEASGATVIIKDVATGTWGESRFLINGTTKLKIDGVEYTYTGGEGTGTLTGVTPDPTLASVTAGDLAIQSVVTSNPSALDNFSNDLISVSNNYVFVGSLKRRDVYMSASDDYTDFAFTSPLRTVGEGFEFLLDSSPSALVPNEDEMWITGGQDDWYKISFELTADHAGESVRIKKFKTSTGQAAINQGSIVTSKNGVLFVSKERTIDFLGKIENQSIYNATPISDPIKEDMLAYDFTGVHGIYFERNSYFMLPEERVLLIYDHEQGYWNPPYTCPFSRLALIDVENNGKVVLAAHSDFADESYRLFDGYNQNGATYEAVAAFGYDNFGLRFDLKKFDEVATELYMSTNTVVKRTILLDYKGATDIKVFDLNGANESTAFGATDQGSHFGTEHLGVNPFGSSLEELTNYRKHRIINFTKGRDFFERQNIFSSASEEKRFSIIAYAENVQNSINNPTFLQV